jgi:hypothetical protein
MSPNEIGALKIERTYYSGCIIMILKHLYFRRSDGYERAIDGHIANVNGSVGNILSDNSNMTKAAEASKDCLFL